MHAHERQDERKTDTPRGVGPAPAQTAASDIPAGPVTPATALALQRAVGNQAVSRLLDEDQHVHDAGCGHEATVQRDLVDEALSSPGRPIETSKRTKLESFYQTDLSDVTVHTGDVAQRSAAAIGAHAFTVGTDIVLGAGAANNDEIIGHEAGHAHKNKLGIPESGADNGAGLNVTNPNQNSETAAAADGAAFAAGAEHAPSLTAQRAITDGTGTATPTVQRVVASKIEEAKKKRKKKKKKKHQDDSGGLQDVEAGPSIPYLIISHDLPSNPWLYGDGNQHFWMGWSGDQPPGYEVPVQQFCGYLAVYWLNNGHSRKGLTAAGLGEARQQSAAQHLAQWGSPGGGIPAQTQYAVHQLGGEEIHRDTLMQEAADGQLAPGTKIMFADEDHTEATYVTKNGGFLIYNPNTGEAHEYSAEGFCAYIQHKDAFVIRRPHSPTSSVMT
jgi:hypothetical protein